MRRLAILLVAAGLVAECGAEPTSPTPQGGVRASTLPAGADSALFAHAGYARWLARLPANLALTAAQKQAIQGYVASFQTATQSDRQALRTLFQQARQARQSGTGQEQFQQLRQQSAPVRERLRAAGAQLRQQIETVLTADQKAWLAANTCDPATAPRLTDAQKAQIKSLTTAFRQANQADLTTLRQAFRQARQARQNGASADQVKAIFANVQPARDRLRAAHQTLAADTQALLTPEQKGSACFAHRPGGFGPGFRRGGMGSGGGPGPGFRHAGPVHSS